MKQKELARWMKGIVVLGFLCVLFLDAIWVPELGRDLAWNTPNLKVMFWPCLIYFWISTIPVMVFMALVWQMATEIGRDNSFCMKNALRLRTCSLLAAADTVYYIIGGVVLLSMNLLHIDNRSRRVCRGRGHIRALRGALAPDAQGSGHEVGKRPHHLRWPP